MSYNMPIFLAFINSFNVVVDIFKIFLPFLICSALYSAKLSEVLH